MRVLIVGGGSAGHVIPALPVIERLKASGHTVTFVGTRSGLEERLVAQAGVRYRGISAGKLRRYFSWQNLTDLFRIVAGVLQSIVLIGRERPQVVFSKGGFVSFPIALAAWLWRVPLVAHESDLTPGLANRLVMPFARSLCVSFPATKVHREGLNILHTGTPLRPSMLHGDAAAGRAALGLSSEQPLLVVTGGSLGATSLNAALRDALPQLLKQYYVLHVTGAGKSEDVAMPGYDQREYVGEGWGDLLAAADVVISRAGANALFELLALRKPNVLVPLDARASRGDQIDNAAYAEAAGYSLVVPDEALGASALLDAVQRVQADRAAYVAAMQTFEVPDAAAAIAAELERVAA